MTVQRDFLLVVTVAAATATPAFGQVTPTVGAANSGKQGAASIPNFTRAWTHPGFPWFEPPASGPGPITNLSRWAGQGRADVGGSLALPPSKIGISNYDQLVGDYKSPVLQIAANRRKFGCIYIGHLPFVGFTHSSFARLFNSANARPARRPSSKSIIDQVPLTSNHKRRLDPASQRGGGGIYY